MVNKEPTIREVAALAGVSVATASRVMNGHAATSEESRARVQAAAEKLNYSPNTLARSLRSAQRQVVGLLVSDIRNPFFSELAYVIQLELWQRGHSMLLGNASEQEQLQDQYLTALRTQRVDGVIAAPQGERSAELERLAQTGVPLVFVDRTLPAPDVPVVNSDPRPGIRQAIRHLNQLGHRQIGFIAGPTNTSTGRERLAVYRTSAAEIMGKDAVMDRPAGYDAHRCTQSVDELIAQGCTALIFGYSPNTVTALQHLAEHGISIPDDLSIISFDEIPFFELSSPRVSIIRQGIVEMGRLAVSTLFAVMGGDRPDSIRIPTELVVRDSTGPAPQTAQEEASQAC